MRELLDAADTVTARWGLRRVDAQAPRYSPRWLYFLMRGAGRAAVCGMLFTLPALPGEVE